MTASDFIHGGRLLAAAPGRTITLPYKDQTETVASAKIFGPLAVHKSICETYSGYTVTHLKTKLAVKKALPSEEAAALVASELLDLDWSFEDKSGCKIKKLDIDARVKMILERE